MSAISAEFHEVHAGRQLPAAPRVPSTGMRAPSEITHLTATPIARLRSHAARRRAARRAGERNHARGRLATDRRRAVRLSRAGGPALRPERAQPLGRAARDRARGLPAARLLRRLAGHADQPARGAPRRAQRRPRARLADAARTPAACAPTPRATARASCPRGRFASGETVTVRGARTRPGARTARVRLPASSVAHEDPISYPPPAHERRRATTRTRCSTSTRAPNLQPPALDVTARSAADGARRPVRRPLRRPRAERADDLRRSGQPRVVPPAARRHRSDQPAGAAATTASRCSPGGRATSRRRASARAKR